MYRIQFLGLACLVGGVLFAGLNGIEEFGLFAASCPHRRSWEFPKKWCART
jgi:hypothetical protein